ncbi:glutamate--tRNA ligase [Mycoplasmopsis hyopharyngis]|uniref:glutamate--tRNA ligase n=1 Tax=Mycoplasmopsis hyopharyngis TaxID=29558 RepID=UPI003873BEAB
MNNKKIRTRYAPSPTGYLHIGGARTALFCYLYAKHLDGDFIFRLEDTDVKRNVKDGEKSQLDNLAWLGIVPDESPQKPNPKCGKYRQSEKLNRYQEIIDELIAKNLAYKAYDTTEELELQHQESEKKGIPSFRYDRNFLKLTDEEIQKRDKAKQYSVRLAMPKDKVYEWDDIVRGKISFNSNEIGDWVIQKSDGYPTYNFAVVVDDHDMSITHILRGEEHITNTPKQLAVYDALKWEVPLFGHMTIITNMEGKKLSKRDTSLKQFIEDYKNEGYHPHAIFNFLSLLGWTPNETIELMSKEEIIQKFDSARLSKSPSKFDIQKMQWFSKQYIKNTDTKELIKILKLNKEKDQEWISLFVDTYKQNVYTYNQILEHKKIYEEIKKEPCVTIEKEDELVVKTFAKILNEVPFTIENIQEAINKTQEITKQKGKKLFMPIRIATTFEEHGPELAKAIFLFGQKVIRERIKKWN